MIITNPALIYSVTIGKLIKIDEDLDRNLIWATWQTIEGFDITIKYNNYKTELYCLFVPLNLGRFWTYSDLKAHDLVNKSLYSILINYDNKWFGITVEDAICLDFKTHKKEAFNTEVFA